MCVLVYVPCVAENNWLLTRVQILLHFNRMIRYPLHNTHIYTHAQVPEGGGSLAAHAG